MLDSKLKAIADNKININEKLNLRKDGPGLLT